jgi:hypothetical protein
VVADGKLLVVCCGGDAAQRDFGYAARLHGAILTEKSPTALLYEK